MAQDIGYDFAAAPTVTLLSANVSDGALSALTSSIDLGAPSPIKLGYELKLDVQVSGNDYAYLKVYWSHDNTDFTDSSPDNGEVVAVVDCTASTVCDKVGNFNVRGRYCKFALENQSGGTINSASTALVLTDIFINQV